MKRGIITILLVAVLAFAAFGSARAAEGKMTLDQFKKLWETEGKTPAGATRCLLIAVVETVKNNNPDGKKMWAMTLPKSYVDANGVPNYTQRGALRNFSRVIKGTSFKGAIATSYLGGTPDNGYKCSYSNKLAVDKAQTRIKPKSARLYVKSGGKDLASPVTLKKNMHGYWKVFEYSSLYTGVKPVKNDDF